MLLKKGDKEKTIEIYKKLVRFFIDSVLGLKDRLALGPINDPIIGIDIKVGEMTGVTNIPVRFLNDVWPNLEKGHNCSYK